MQMGFPKNVLDFPFDHTRNNDFAHWCTLFGNTFPGCHNQWEAETAGHGTDERFQRTGLRYFI